MHDKISAAVQLHQSGRFAEAEVMYRSVLSRDPKQPDALHLLGVLAGQTQRGAEAVQLIQRAVELRPDYTDAHANLGRILFDLGEHERALASYKRVTELKRYEPSAWFAYGVALRNCGKPDEAITAFEKTIKFKSSDAQAHSELGSLLRSAGRLDESIASHTRAVSLNPYSPDVHNGLANALLDKGRIDDAINEFMSAVRLDQRRIVFHTNLAGALTRVGRLDESIIAYEFALNMDSNNPDALSGLAISLSRQLRHEESLLLFHRALALKPDDEIILNAMAGTLYAKHDVDKAQETFQSVIDRNPRSVDAWIGIGQAQRAKGQFEESTESFRKAVEIDPNNAIALKNLSAIGVVSAPDFVRLEQMLHQPDLGTDDRVATGFALGKLLDDAEQFDEAFDRYSEANTLFKAKLVAEGQGFDPVALQASVKWQTGTFTSGYFQTTRDWGNPSEVPVFVVGMPRSGTTLVEQIAASHPQVFGAGELTDIGDITKRCMTDPHAADGRWTREMISSQAGQQLAKLNQLSPHVLRIVDKMPANVLNLGIIADLFPNARIVMCQRDPRDTCLSCYFQWFGQNAQVFSYDLQDCANYYRGQQQMVEHWKAHLPLRILTVQYEEMVGNLEGQSRRLIDFLGLEWDSRCLEFHKTKRTVSTASVWQVRQPIYTSSVGRWKHYEKHLGPLIGGLGL